MSVFIALAQKASRSMSTYSINTVMFAIGGGILLIVQASIWGALYAQGGAL